MFDLSKFSDTCAYCYKGIRHTLTICSCNNSLCDDHRTMHTSKFDCHTLYTLSLVNGEVKVSGGNDASESERKISIKIKNGMVRSTGTYPCSHVYDASNPVTDFTSTKPKCQECDIKENLWICIECGHVGCGRKQKGMEGNGHAMMHFEATKDNKEHPNVALLSSVKNGVGDVFCYVCEDFVQNPLKLNIKIENGDVKSFNDITLPASQKSVSSDLLGIENEGVNCYVSAVLHLLHKVVGDTDMSFHFTLCDSHPMNCLACQLVKVLNEMRKVKNEVKSVKITGLLDCIYAQMNQFSPDSQQDCPEFLQNLLERIECFETCMLLPGINGFFEYAVENVCECGKYVENIQGNILYIPFRRSVEEGLMASAASAQMRCECGKASPVFKKLRNFLVVSIARYRYNSNGPTKIDEPMDVRDLSLRTNDGIAKAQVIGCICHSGNMTSGHYTWWEPKEKTCYVVNDALVTKSDMEYSKNASFVLFRILK